MSDRRQRELLRAAQSGDQGAELAYLRDRRDRTQDAGPEELAALANLELQIAMEMVAEGGEGWGDRVEEVDALFVQSHNTMRQALRIDPLNVDLIVRMFALQYVLMEEGFMIFPAVRTIVTYDDIEPWVVNTVAIKSLFGDVYRPPYRFERLETAIWTLGEDGEREEGSFEIVADAYPQSFREAAEQHVKVVSELMENGHEFTGLLSSGFEQDPVHYLTWQDM